MPHIILPENRPIPLVMGGRVSTKNIVGRDDYISRLWEDLQHNSIIINEIRRTGKTAVLRLMENSPPKGWICVRASVQDVKSKTALTELTLKVLLKHAGIGEKIKNSIRAFGQTAEEAKVKAGVVEFSLRPDYQKNAFSVFRPLLKNVNNLLEENNQKLVIIWDEFPDAIRAIRKRETADAVDDMLSLFRVLREDDDSSNIRWILTGSVGFHHVLKGQRELINDMITVGVPPLSSEWTCWLAKSLLLGIDISDSDVQAISEISGGIPFVLVMLVKYIRDQGLAVPRSGKDAKLLLFEAASSPEYRTNWVPLLERVGKYYEKKYMPLVKHILDTIGANPLSASNLYPVIRSGLNDKFDDDDIENIEPLGRLTDKRASLPAVRIILTCLLRIRLIQVIVNFVVYVRLHCSSSLVFINLCLWYTVNFN